MFRGFVAFVEEVEHFSSVELGAAANPVAAGGLSGCLQVILCGGSDLVLAAQRVGQAEVGHMEAGLDEVAWIFCVGEDGVVEDDGSETVAGVFSEIGYFEAEEVVVRVLVCEAFLDADGFGVASVVAEEKG